MHFIPGQIPHVEDREGMKAYCEALYIECKRLGGRPKKTWGRAKLREMYSQLKKKRELEILKAQANLEG